MRKIIFGGATSLDNFFARQDDAVDWLMWSDEAQAIMAQSWARFDTILMGRRTYEISLRHGSGNNHFAGIKTYVFSRTLPPPADNSVEIISDNAIEFVRQLKAQPGKDICVMGGGLFGAALLEANLIDEIGFNVHPVLLGSGIPVFHQLSHQINLELLTCQPLKNGCVYLNYQVKHA